MKIYPQIFIIKLKFILFILFAGSNCFAGLFRVESETYSSARKNDAYQVELPFYENLSTSYVSNKKDFEFNSNISLLADPTASTHNAADLHIFDIKFQAIPEFMEVRIGRSLQSSIAKGSLDMLSVHFSWLNKQIQLGPFVGIERKLSAPTSELLGIHFAFYTDEALPYFFSTKIIQKNYHNTSEKLKQDTSLDTTENSNDNFSATKENLLQVSGKKNLTGSWSPELIFDTQANLSRNNLDRFEAGIDLYPSILTYTKLRAMSYDVLPDSGTEQAIYSIFSVGRLYETRLQYQKKIHSQLISGISFFADNYQLQENQRTTGYGTEWELKWLQDYGYIDNSIYVFSSYGGKVIGNRFLIQSDLKNELYALFDISYYEKITSSKRNVINTEIGCSQYFGKQYKLSFGGELNSNNILLYDVRAFAKLTFLLWNDT